MEGICKNCFSCIFSLYIYKVFSCWGKVVLEPALLTHFSFMRKLFKSFLWREGSRPRSGFDLSGGIKSLENLPILSKVNKYKVYALHFLLWCFWAQFRKGLIAIFRKFQRQLALLSRNFFFKSNVWKCFWQIFFPTHFPTRLALHGNDVDVQAAEQDMLGRGHYFERAPQVQDGTHGSRQTKQENSKGSIGKNI